MDSQNVLDQHLHTYYEILILPVGSLACRKDFINTVWWLIRFSNAFVFPDPEPPTISILNGWSGTCNQSGFVPVYFLL